MVVGVVFDMENQKKQLTSAGRPRNQLKNVIKVWGQKLWSRFLLVPGLSGARESFFLILHIKNCPQYHSILFIRVVTYPKKLRAARFSWIPDLAYLRIHHYHGPKHETICLNLNHSSGKSRADNGRNNEKEDRNLIYASGCTIRISFLSSDFVSEQYQKIIL